MIVLDEQLLGRGLEQDIAQWYRGTVQFITDLRVVSLAAAVCFIRLLQRCTGRAHRRFFPILQGVRATSLTSSPP